MLLSAWQINLFPAVDNVFLTYQRCLCCIIIWLFVLTTVSFCILLIFLCFFAFFNNTFILRHYQRGQEELVRLAAVLLRLDHWREPTWDSKAIDVLVLLVLRWSLINQLNKWAPVALVSSASHPAVSASSRINLDVPSSKMSPSWCYLHFLLIQLLCFSWCGGFGLLEQHHLASFYHWKWLV